MSFTPLIPTARENTLGIKENQLKEADKAETATKLLTNCNLRLGSIFVSLDKNKNIPEGKAKRVQWGQVGERWKAAKILHDNNIYITP